MWSKKINPAYWLSEAIAQILNNFVAPYFENMDSETTSLGLRAGNLVLTDLKLKMSALDFLKLPVKPIVGRVGKLSLSLSSYLKILSSPIIVELSDVYLILAPGQQVQYDAAEELAREMDIKKSKILQVELAKKAEEAKDKSKDDLTFTEKFVAAVIRLVQIHISNVHIRYEDKMTSSLPFALGITLRSIDVESTDQDWKPSTKTDNVTKIYKVLKVEGFAIYWNSGTTSYESTNVNEMLEKMAKSVASKKYTPSNYAYILGPINVSGRLKINQRPELDDPPFSIPKYHVNIDMEKLFIGVSKLQYRDILALGESLDQMFKAAPNRKYRPNVPSYKGHYKEWWHFAYTCILEGDIRRKRQNWDWNHIHEHRQLCREYGTLYEKKLQNLLKDKNEIKRFEECEQHIDVFNIVIIRQRKELEIKRKQPQTAKGSWWSWGSKSVESVEDAESAEKYVMSKEEKESLYKALDYQENAAPAQFPEEYVDNSATFLLRTLEVELQDNSGTVQRVIFTELKGVCVRVDTRVAASALKVHVKIDEFTTFGLQQDDFIPRMINSETGGGDTALLEVSFETNPIDKTCGQRIYVSSQPLQIVYDAQTILKVIDIFKTPSSTALDQISAAADASLENFKEMSSTGLQYAIETHTHIDLKIDLQAPFIIIPYGGKYMGSENALIINLGNLQMYSLARPPTKSVRQMTDEGYHESDILKQLIAQSYDRFQVELNSLQVMIAQSNEDWKTYIKENKTAELHLLKPINLKVKLSKCMITDDPRLPLTKIDGELPSITINVTDARLLLLTALVSSIPLPESEAPPPEPLTSARRSSSSTVMLKYLEMQEKASKTKQLLPKEKKHDQIYQFTTLEVNFVMADFSLELKHQENLESAMTNVATFNIKSLELDLVQQTFNTKVELRLAAVRLVQIYKGQPIDIIKSSDVEKGENYLFDIKFTQVDKNSPEFHSVYKSCETGLILEFAKLAVILHKECLLDLMKYATTVQSDVEEILGQNRPRVASTTTTPHPLKSQLSTISEKTADSTSKQDVKKEKKLAKSIVVETVKFKLVASVQELTVEFSSHAARISSCAVQALSAEVIVKTPYTQVIASLKKILIIDLNPKSYHNMILSVLGDEALSARVVMYNLDKEVDTEKADMLVDVTMGGLRIVFLNWFVSRMLDFLNEFQTAQAAIIEASKAAAETAKENMASVYTKATKLALYINLKAPDIIVPANSTSYDAILLDMGHITISNKFITLDIKNENNFSAVIDEMKIALSDFKLSRIKLNFKDEAETELNLLAPLTFRLIVRRNLSNSWYKAVPDIDVVGQIEAITLMLSQIDYDTIMSIVNGNLAEGQKSQPAAAPVTATKTPNVSKATIEEVALINQAGAAKEAAPELDTEAKSNTFLRFTFTMDRLAISLYAGGSELNTNTHLHDEAFGLARFGLEGISTKGRLLSDGTMMASFLLINCFMDDMRKGREGKLNRLFHRTLDPNESMDVGTTKSMIDVIIQTKKNHTFLDLRVFSFTLILSMEFLVKVGDFFKTSEKDEPPRPIPAPAKTTTSQTTIQTVPPKTDQPESQLTLNLKIEKPDIILVEHMDNIDTKALILNSEVLIKLRTSGAHQVINGSVKDLQVYTCVYDPEKRAKTRSNVLYPFTISLAGSTPEGKGLHLELLITDIRISVSPATIELISRVMATMTAEGPSDQVVSEQMKDYSDLWEMKRYDEQKYWFLRGDEAVEVTEGLVLVPSPKSLPVALEELCLVSVPAIVITVEAGVGQKTLPMLIMQSSLKGYVHNWSSQMKVDAGLSLQMSYYNSRLALWEPLVEPVEVRRGSRIIFVPWELKVLMFKSEPSDEPTSPSEPEGLEDEPTHQHPQQPAMRIEVSSERSIELVVTKTCLEVINNLGKAFATAMKPGEMKEAIEGEASYKVVNELGCPVTLPFEKGSFVLFEDESTEQVVLETGAQVLLQKKMVASTSTYTVRLLDVDATDIKDYKLCVYVEDKNCEIELPVVRADKRFFPLKCREGGDTWGVISDIIVDEGVTVITLRSILQVHNHFNIPIEVYYMTDRGNELESITTVQPDSVVNIPLKAVYTPTTELFFSVAGYSVTTTPYVWKTLQTDVAITKTLHCSAQNPEQGIESFIIKAVGEMEQVYFENTNKHTVTSTCYNIYLRPAVVFKNCLPLNIILCIENTVAEFTLEPGETHILPNVEPGKSSIVVRLPEYLEKEWSTRQEVDEDPQEFAVWPFHSYDSPVKVTLNLGMHIIVKNGSVVMALYCPFWMLNKTGLMLAYRKSKKLDRSDVVGSPSKSSDDASNVLHHPADFKGPILFSFNAKNFFGKKKASVKVEKGEWSDKFSLDVAGSSGVVVCKYDNMIYQVGVHNQLTYNGLTKQVTFTPYYVIINNAPFAIECQESDRPADPWISVEPNSCVALWPKSELDDKLLKLRAAGTSEVSAPFLYTESHTSLLKLTNKLGGINVDIQISEGAVYINLAQYEVGTAPALIINHTQDNMNFWEKESVQVRILSSKHCMLYTWDNPSGPRILVWEGFNKKEYFSDLRKDGGGDYTITDNYTVYWVSFLDGMQRVLLFTQDKSVAENARSANLYEMIAQEITVSIQGVGLSLVNNQSRQEVMYMAMASSGVIWEQSKMTAERYKHMSHRESMVLEGAYQMFLVADEDERPAVTRVDNKTEVNFNTLVMLKPHKRKIRRSFQTGLWIQMKSSPSQLQLHAKINRLQIDNQMYDCIFPVVLAPVPPPKSVAMDSGIKPFAELSIVQLLMKNSQTKQYKYFKLLIQEFHIKVDLGFVNALAVLFQGDETNEQEERELFLKDKALVDEPLYAHVSTQSLQEQKSFYDLLHFSPLKIHVSFSLAAGSSAGQSSSTPNFLNVLLQGIGVTLTDLQDVVFKLAYFEREYTFLTKKQLIDEAVKHYVGQSVKQLYVLVLGLDVIGNPYGLVVGITKGVEDLFYEPFQGAIQGPGEFAEGLVLGVRSLFGHTVGGAAGAVSRITGAMGKGIAVLTFDKEYQRKRRDQINKKPASVQEGIARSGKGLVMGVVDGVTGVFTKPVQGARQEGVGGFFKGLGKGAVGLVARPTAGVVDFASGSLDAVKRATEFSEDATRLRPPRFLQSDGLVRPYSSYEANGNKMLTDLEKGKYATTDIYVAHYPIVEKREVLLLTDKRLAFITHNEIFGGWQVEWSYKWQDLKHPPSVVPKGVAISTGDTKKRSLFGSGDGGKIILIGDPERREEVCQKIELLRQNA